jgi:hypothetical protein
MMRQADMDGTLTFEPAPPGTRMHWSWYVRPKGAFRLLVPLITWMGSHQEQTMRASMKRHLDTPQPGRNPPQAGPGGLRRTCLAKKAKTRCQESAAAAGW